MKVGKSLLRRFLLAVISFLILDLAIFIFWRSFSDTVLVAPFINPHSTVPLQVQVQYIKEYLGLNVPVYLQYFTFLRNIFIGRWANLVPSIAYTVFNTIFLMLLSFLLGILFSFIFGKIRKLRPLKGSLRIILAGIGVVLFGIALPLLVRYILVFSGMQYLLNAGGSIPAGYTSWITEKYVFTSFPVIGTRPTHILLVDAIINLSPGYAFLFIIHMIPAVISTALIIAAILHFMKGRALFKYRIFQDNPTKNLENNKQTPQENRFIRRELLSKAGLLILFTEAAVIFNETVYRYESGLGYYLTKFIQFSPGFYFNDKNVWPLSYWWLTFGLILILGSLFTGFYYDLTRRGSEKEVQIEAH